LPNWPIFITHADPPTKNGEYCLQKSLPNSGKLTITNYLKQNAFAFQTHVSIENNLKIKNVVISKTSTIHLQKCLGYT